jgi:hypothetical protein
MVGVAGVADRTAVGRQTTLHGGERCELSRRLGKDKSPKKMDGVSLSRVHGDERLEEDLLAEKTGDIAIGQSRV